LRRSLEAHSFDTLRVLGIHAASQDEHLWQTALLAQMPSIVPGTADAGVSDLPMARITDMQLLD
jgi:hypothetical protein